MEKQEARIVCTGCGTSYKLKVPATEEPVNFQCKQCGKILKIKLALPSASTPQDATNGSMEHETLPGLEATRFPDSDAFTDDAPHPPTSSAKNSNSRADDESSHELDFSDMEEEESHPEGAPPFEEAPKFDEKIPDDRPAFDPDRMFEQQQERMRRDLEAKRDAPDANAPSGTFSVLQMGTPGQTASTPGATADQRAAVTDSQESQAEESQTPFDKDRRWLVLTDEKVLGPFTTAEITSMVEEGEITADSPLRMGQRPWIKASQITEFRDLFKEGALKGKAKAADLVLEDEETIPEGHQFYTQLSSVFTYPLRALGPFLIFTIIASVLCSVLSYKPLIGFPLSIVGWIFLYGYLGEVLNQSREYPSNSAPAWDFSAAGYLFKNGLQFFLVLLFLCLIPLLIMLLLVIAFFLSSMAEIGYVCIGVLVLVYAGSLFVTPISLVLVSQSGKVGAGLSPGSIGTLIKGGRKASQKLSIISIVIGLLAMVVVLGVLLNADLIVKELGVDEPGYFVVGFVTALFLSFLNFVWFHALGRFCGENNERVRGALSASRA